ncbi:MAG: hypothetical protein H7339_18920 [Arcicella sp.]|nr:hypothetical protein [Arcicella sp.]
MQKTMRFKNIYEAGKYLIYQFVSQALYSLTIGNKIDTTLSLVNVEGGYLLTFRGVETFYTNFKSAVNAFKTLFYDWRYNYTGKGYYLSLYSVDVTGNVYSGYGVPLDSVGVDGSEYLDLDTLNVYKNVNGVW